METETETETDAIWKVRRRKRRKTRKRKKASEEQKRAMKLTKNSMISKKKVTMHGSLLSIRWRVSDMD
jgi:hypothetical protein